MNADTVAVLLIIIAAPAATLFPVLYALSAPWWRTAIGRSLMTSSVGLALLIDISLLYLAFGDNYGARDVVRLSVYLLIVAGAWMQLGVLVESQIRRRRQHRP